MCVSVCGVSLSFTCRLTVEIGIGSVYMRVPLLKRIQVHDGPCPLLLVEMYIFFWDYALRNIDMFISSDFNFRNVAYGKYTY